MGLAEGGGHCSPIIEPPTAAGPIHYAAAMTLVAAVVAGIAFEVGRWTPTDTASQVDNAVMIELPPLDAGSHPQGDDAPPQKAAPASVGAQAPQPLPKPPDAVALPRPSSPALEKLPKAADPSAALEPLATPPPQAQAPASAPQEAHEVGAPVSAPATIADAEETEMRRASAHRITLWQKALMGRLQSARHGLAEVHVTGIAKIAFAIDHDGRLLSEHVALGSGSKAIDAAALTLVRRAAPFPPPPPNSGETELTFTVPISFKR